MNKTKIDWCDSTWNPVTGCLHGCEYCYARGISERFGTLFKGDILPEDEGLDFLPDEPERFFELDEPVRDANGKIEPYPANFYPTFYRYKLNDYIGKQSRNIFVCSMADLFGSWVPDSWLDEIFEVCEKTEQHNYLFLTKNVERYCKYGVPMLDNMWYGISITRESEMCLFNQLPAFCNTFVSFEPILEDLKPEKHNVMFRQVKWVIIGAETGRRKNKVVPERKWIEDIVNECRSAYRPVPVFMKSSLAEIWGEPLIQEFPEGLRRRKYVSASD